MDQLKLDPNMLND